MGGFGSGRRNQGGKATTSEYPAVLDVRWLNREGLLVPSLSAHLRWSMRGETLGTLWVCAEDDRVRLRRGNLEGERSGPAQQVFLDWSLCNLGGQRPWFRCPACSRRVALLYGAGSFACRHCHRLVYASQREKSHVRALRKVDRLRDKLHWGPGILPLDRSRPKGMHRRTYARLAAEQDGLVRQYLLGMNARFEGLERCLD